ncbi:MAG: TonB-dependent receptor [Myxococcota bacterium]
MRSRRTSAAALVAAGIALATPATSRAAPEETDTAALTEAAPSDPSDLPPAPLETIEAPEPEDESSRVVRVGRRRPKISEAGRSATVVTREEIEQKLPRSAPDALKGEPGIYLQQTAHGQGSPYLRGLTGQQTVMFFDGVRVNNSTFRQGPNQYFFTIDARTIQKLEILRGSASTRYGSDAIGGALLSTPIDPTMTVGDKPWTVHPRVITRFTTADAEIGGRAQVDLSYRGKLGIFTGVGYRNVGQLRSGGRVIAPATGQPQNVPPAFEADDETQRGTGFRELTSDARIVYQPRTRYRFTLGYYDYRQFDVPRTDKCPPPTAPEDECLRYLQQFRTLAYGAFDATSGPKAAETVRMTLSYQNQHERRQLTVGSPSLTENHGDDDVHSLGTGLRIDTHEFELGKWVTLKGRYGADAYLDLIDSEAWVFFRDVQIRSDVSRGQYLDGGRYLSSGLWADAEFTFIDAIHLRGGGRGALIHGKADGDAESESAPIDSTWATPVGHVGFTVDPVQWLSFHGNVDQGFRAPNMDDLTSRQQTGPGFQFENPDLDPERSLSTEIGLTIDHPWIEISAWGYQTRIRDLVGRAPRQVEDCPANASGCDSSQTRFQLVNLDGFAFVRGTDVDLRVYLPFDLRLRNTLSYAWGDGPNPIADIGDDQPARTPLSRIPPLNGMAEVGWQGGSTGLYVYGVVRWAQAQTRLALADTVDVRIPLGGTPGYTVFDVRAGYRLDRRMLIAAVFENIGDAAYRHHGSSVNGAGRGLSLQLEFGF